jgi:hypothetical protein
VAQLDGPRWEREAKKWPRTVPYASSGHPSIEQLMAEQGTGPITDVSVLHGDFWPEEESVEGFVATIREWRGHKRTVDTDVGSYVFKNHPFASRYDPELAGHIALISFRPSPRSSDGCSNTGGKPSSSISPNVPPPPAPRRAASYGRC